MERFSKWRLFKNVGFSIIVLLMMFVVVIPSPVYATDLSENVVQDKLSNDNTTVPVPISNSELKNTTASVPILDSSSSINLAGSYVAKLTIFSVGSGTSSSTGGYGHSWITVNNLSTTTNIQVGLLSGIAPGKTVTLGTWGNEPEHTGLWYNLEACYLSVSNCWPGRVSTSINLTATQLNTMNNYIKNHDSYAVLNNNCSTFASGAWNSVASTPVNAGAPNAPAFLVNSIKYFSYSTNASVPYYYAVYYANGTNTPKKSSTH